MKEIIKSLRNCVLLTGLFLVLSSCGGGSGGGGGGGGSGGGVTDTTPPMIISTIPMDSATDISVNTSVTATFSEAMDSTTITGITFHLKETVSGKLVTGTLTYNGTTATFTPSSTLTDNISYTATITTGVKDLAGNPMATDKVSSFTTIDVPGGTVDSSLGGVGYITTDISADGDDAAYAVAIQADGKIVVAGRSDQDPISGTYYDFAVTRYLSSGDLDPAFNSNGMVVHDLGNTNRDAAYAVAIQIDGKIIVAGSTFNGSNWDFAVMRYNADGTPDGNFGSGGNGMVETDVSGSGYDDMAYAVAIQGDGKIVIAGCVSSAAVVDACINEPPDPNTDFVAVRYLSDGTLDVIFDRTDVSGSGAADMANALSIQRDGKIVVAGYADNGADFDFALVRYNADGSLPGFGSGKVVTDISGSNDVAKAVVLQSDEKIVVAGYSDAGGGRDFAVVRYKTDGSLDSTFNGDGIVTTDINGGSDTGFGVGVQGDGKIIVAGDAAGATRDIAIVRYDVNGVANASFGNNGIVTKMINEFNYTKGVAIQPDGKIVVVGETFPPSGLDSEFFVLRYWP